jgi:hypothetical protein
VRFVGIDKCERCFNVALSWYGEQFSDLVKKRSKDPKFAEEWKEADEVCTMLEQGEDLKKVFPNSAVVRTIKRTGIQTSQKYHFLTVKEYKKVFKTAVKIRREMLAEVQDEENLRTLKGIIVKPTLNDGLESYRKVKFFSETVWLVDECLAPKHRPSHDQSTH